MKHHEKKYKVASFDSIKSKLDELGAKQIKDTSSTHYYAPQESNDVVKLVHYSDRNEIHILKETNGTFSLAENNPVTNLETGLQWLRDKGYKKVDVVKMDYTDYEYDSGVVGLYIINDDLHSVILDFPLNMHSAIEEVFELGNAEVITVPYNKYLEQAGLSATEDLTNG